jgi:hypothetical protein
VSAIESAALNAKRKGVTMTVTSRPAQSTNHRGELNEPPAASSLCVIDFAAARDRLLPETDESIIQFEIKQELRRVAAQRKSSAELFDPVEDCLYWLISAAALVSLLLGILGLLDFTMPRTQSIDVKQSGRVERALSGGRDRDSTGESLTMRSSRLTRAIC